MRHKSKKNDEKELVDDNIILDMSKVVPRHMSSVFNKKPYIYFSLLDIQEDVNLYSIRMYVDNKIVPSEVSRSGVSYTPRKDLSIGKHDVKIEYVNGINCPKEINWFFIISDKESKYKPYFGIPHCHTSYSSGEGLPYDAYDKARKRGLDFLIVTDHSRRLKGKGVMEDKKLLRNIKDFNKWDSTKYISENINKKHNRFLALTGFEISTSFLGHINVYNTKNFIPAKLKSLDRFIEWLRTQESPIVSINHPSKSKLYVRYSNDLDKFINLVEVGNGAPPYKYIRSEEIYYKLLDEGWHLGAINSQDNHKTNWGDTENLTVILTEKLNEDSFREALLNRRTYSTESRTLKFYVTINEHCMGSIINIAKGENLNFNIYAEDKKNQIQSIQIISNGGTIVKEKEFSKEKKIKWRPVLVNCDEFSWYVVKVIQKNDKVAIASAIFC